jgi:hypothetical protein
MGGAQGLERRKVVCGAQPWRVTDRVGSLPRAGGPLPLCVAWLRIEEPRKEPEPSLEPGFPIPPNSDIIN